jgi:hypothetical protein
MNLDTLIRDVNPAPVDAVPGPGSLEARAILEAIAANPSGHHRWSQPRPWTHRVQVVAVVAIILAAIFVPLPRVSLFRRLVFPVTQSTATSVPTTVPKTPPIGTQLGELRGSDSGDNDSFGQSVAVSGTTAVVGAPGHANGAGRAYVFSKTATGWKQVAELKGSDSVGDDHSGYNSGDNFGGSVDISGTTAIVGAQNHQGDAGRAYVFTKTATGWKQVAELKGSDTVALDYFGSTVAISGTFAVVGAPGADEAYVFRKTATSWKQVAELKGSDTGFGLSGDNFGASVAISDTRVLVGTDMGESGRTYVFTRTATSWKQTAELKGPDTMAGYGFGGSVAISGTTAVVGSAQGRRPGGYGAAYVFTKSARGWKQVAELTGSSGAGATSSNGSDSVVAISGETAVISYGGLYDVFTKTARGWKQAADLEIGGASVAISGTTVVVGEYTSPAYVFQG